MKTNHEITHKGALELCFYNKTKKKKSNNWNETCLYLARDSTLNDSHTIRKQQPVSPSILPTVTSSSNHPHLHLFIISPSLCSPLSAILTGSHVWIAAPGFSTTPLSLHVAICLSHLRLSYFFFILSHNELTVSPSCSLFLSLSPPSISYAHTRSKAALPIYGAVLGNKR